jgi:hypothetical protein
MDDIGISNKDGGGTLLPFIRFPPSLYPVSNAISADKWPRYPGGDVRLLPDRAEIVVNQVDYLNGTTRGLAYCDVAPGSVIHGDLAEALDRQVKLTAKVDGQEIAGGAKSWRGAGFNLRSFFERDEYYFTVFELSIESTRGDV